MSKFGDISICVGCQEECYKTEMIEGRDHVPYCADCFKSLYCAASGDSQSSELDFSEKLIPYPEIYMQAKKTLNIGYRNPSTTSLSKRPIQCPKANCNKFVSLFTLGAHFKYEHKEVPIILTQLDARSALEFYPRDIAHNVTKCIVLLNVINYDFSNIIQISHTSSTTIQSLDSGPLMVLQAIKISTDDLNESEDDLLSTSDVGNIESVSSVTYVEDGREIGLRHNEKIMIWLASNVYTSLSYTVAASTLSNKIRQKYYGPLLTLGDTAADLCRTGTCLMLTYYHVRVMSENGTKPLSLDIVIHSPD
ncbi:uncharacterized protein LOC114334951 [Diabrotica virgifera virgifera]|uniref:C2H2-type domain-containing protein n=1 Tax=Diabrotica virgifera virgifera TaxID=50390 RepID=A0ABM5KWL4_DIAVI|nr:uncharacterized protein LOC114334951 [Diabrotica virgifera virgifera]